MRKPIIPSRPASSGGEPGPKKQRTTKKLSNKGKSQEKPKLAEYTIKGEKVLRPYHEPGYSDAHRGGIATRIIAVWKYQQERKRMWKGRQKSKGEGQRQGREGGKSSDCRSATNGTGIPPDAFYR